MPLYDFECPECGEVSEHILGIKESDSVVIFCHRCKEPKEKIITNSGHYCSNQDADWIKSVLDVVDKSNPAKETQDFIKNPNRKNYKQWMKSEGIRPLEHGEKPKQEQFDVKAHAEKVMQLQMKRRAISI